MTPAQRATYVVICEWWKQFGYGPTISDVMAVLGEKGRENVVRKIAVLVRKGFCVKLEGGTHRSIMPKGYVPKEVRPKRSKKDVTESGGVVSKGGSES